MKYMTLSPEAASLSLLTCCTLNSEELHGNDLTSGIPYKEESVRIEVKGGEPYYADIILAEPSMIPVISPQLASTIKKSHFQYGEMIPVVNGFYKNFYIINPIPLIDLLDEEESAFIFVNGKKIYYAAHLKEYAGPEGIYRIKMYSKLPFVTNAVFQMLNQFNHKGITFSDDLVKFVKRHNENSKE